MQGESKRHLILAGTACILVGGAYALTLFAGHGALPTPSSVSTLWTPTTVHMSEHAPIKYLNPMAVLVDSQSLHKACVTEAKLQLSKLPSHFQTVIAAPVILIGNLSETQLNQGLDEMIEPIIQALQSSYCTSGITRPVTLVLLKDTSTFRDMAWKLDQRKPTSYYGYYEREKRRMVIDLSTGGGTLAHELTHVLMQDHFPNMSLWFDEGIASLHEESELSAHNEQLIGLPNWRGQVVSQILPGKLPFKQMLEDRTYIEQNPRTAYALARYLCLYLQDQNLLQTYFANCREHQADDPHGTMSLLEVTGSENLSAFETQFKHWFAIYNSKHQTPVTSR
jgi:hypothetical protein